MNANPPPSPNPYAPPTADTDAQSLFGPELTDTATRWQRLGGAIVDGVLAALTAIPAMVGRGSTTIQLGVSVGSTPVRFDDTSILGTVSTVLIIGLWLLQSYLIAVSGQSIGKRAAGTRIVALDGSPAPFVKAVLLRTWTVLLLPFVPAVGSFIAVVDILFIFGREKRCLHDLVAGTKVVTID